MGWYKIELTCLPARPRRVKFWLIGGACHNVRHEDVEVLIMEELDISKYEDINEPKELTFESQSCKSCETTLFSNPWRQILTSIILYHNNA